MNFKRSTKTLCIFCMILLFVQCEKKEMFLTEGNQPDAAQNLKAKKDKPPGQDKTVEEYATITAGDVAGEGCYVNEDEDHLFTLTITDHFNHYDDNGIWIIESGEFEGTIRFMYSTKRKGENRIDFWYTDDGGVDKYLLIRQANPNNAYDPENRIMTLYNAYALLAYRDGTHETYWEYTASATVHFKDCD